MPENYAAVHAGIDLVCAVGTRGKITMFRRGSIYQAEEVPIVTTHDLRAVFVESSHSAWCVGDGGTILHFNGERWWPVATATHLPGPLNTVWGHRTDGVWLAGAHYIIHRHPTAGSSFYDSDVAVRAIWGRGPDDLWLVCDGRLVMHWGGEKCDKISLPGDDDEEWAAVAGTTTGDTFLVGPSGFLMKWDGRYWTEITTDTTAILTGAVCLGSSLFVTTDDGFVREYRRGEWRTVAFSAFGGGLRGICATDDGIVWAVGDRGVVLMHRPDWMGE